MKIDKIVLVDVIVITTVHTMSRDVLFNLVNQLNLIHANSKST